VTKPCPVPKSWMILPRPIRLFGVLTLPSSFSAASCPFSWLPVTNSAGDTWAMDNVPEASTWPRDFLTTWNSTVPELGVFMGTRKLICPGETK
jgi:hypothetical protein